ncbi:hypothetical protein KFE25_013494 [Diacronema lutheri]|uniref:Uncharacterized protein n=1 Tax=Diacronema lutheri TaxID=2081491 RepID=A0A8J6CES6_DIALT|nr:hypothetical protein KFE25_013494 [Diacronema lutheri]
MLSAIATTTLRSLPKAHGARALLSTQVHGAFEAPPPPMPATADAANAPDAHELLAIKQKQRLASELARQMIAEAQARAPDGGQTPSP